MIGVAIIMLGFILMILVEFITDGERKNLLVGIFVSSLIIAIIATILEQFI